MSENSPQKILQRYLSEKKLVRILFVLVVILALAAGYYQSLFANENKKYLRLEDKYVRVRGQLGREETQRLIDESQKQEAEANTNY
jgi:hypothetical protein